MSDVFRDYLKTHKEILPEPPSRIVPVSSKLEEQLVRGPQNVTATTTRPSRHKKAESLFSVGGLPRGVRLYTGDAPGVEPVQLSDGHTVPVPLHAPKFILRCDNEESSIEFPIGRLGDDAKFVCIVVNSQEKDGTSKVEISKAMPISDFIKNGSSTANQGSSAHP